jgi:SH3 domain-containing protein
MRSARSAVVASCTGLLLAVVGCAPVARPLASDTPVPGSTFTAIPTLTATPVSLPTVSATAPTPADEGTSTSPYFAVVSAENVNLRTHPGTVFPVRLLLAKGTRVQVLGHAPGGEWLYVQTDTNVNGWLLYWLVNGGHDGGPTPLVEPADVQIIRGKIVDRAGIPVSGIGFAVTQGSGPNAPRTDATSDDSGLFYAYLPKSASGEWYISYVSVACTSNTMDAKCNCIGACGTADPPGVTVALPSEGILQFNWK